MSLGRRLIFAAVAVAALSLYSGHALGAVGAAPAGQDRPVVELVMTEYAFAPSDPRATAGPGLVRLINAGIRRHHVVILVDGVEHTSPEARPGDSVDWELQIDRPGTYQFWCGEYRHLEQGMTGTLVVE